jgi:hypothetical protein
MDNDLRFLDSQFRIVSEEMELIQAKIHQRRGILFIEYHAYSQDELLESKHHARIYSVTELIGSNIRCWEAAGNISKAMLDAYNRHRDEIEKKLHQLNLTISKRDPTWWENVRFVCEQFKNDVMAHLPEVVRWAIEAVVEGTSGGVFGMLKMLFLNGKSEQKRLPGSEDEDE